MDLTLGLVLCSPHPRGWSSVPSLPAAEFLAQRAIDTGDPGALLLRLADWREEGDREAAQTLAQRAADTGHPAALIRLAGLLER